MSTKLASHFRYKLMVLVLYAGVLILWVAMGWPCIIRTLTGIPCAGCGMSRAWLAALRLDFGSAFRFHPMFWSIPVLILFALFDGKPFRSAFLNRFVLIAILLGLAVCYAVRLVAFLRGENVF